MVFQVGANPTRRLSLQPVGIGAVAEVTKRLKPRRHDARSPVGQACVSVFRLCAILKLTSGDAATGKVRSEHGAAVLEMGAG